MVGFDALTGARDRARLVALSGNEEAISAVNSLVNPTAAERLCVYAGGGLHPCVEAVDAREGVLPQFDDEVCRDFRFELNWTMRFIC
jgi:hypothetical protein